MKHLETKSRPQSELPVYVLYDWHGKCKWLYLEGVFLVDPQFEMEFVQTHGRP